MVTRLFDLQLNPSLCEPPSTRTAWFILSKIEGLGGVLKVYIGFRECKHLRGSPC